MSLFNLSTADLVGLILGFTFTILVFSYILGDNPLFRFTIHIFIGVASGYAAVTSWYSVVWPQLIHPLIFGSRSERLFVLVPLIMSGLLLLKISPRLSRLGSPAMAYLVGVGAATAVGGAVLGTLIPQVIASINLLDIKSLDPSQNVIWQLTRGSIILFGTVSTLVYFQFGSRRKKLHSPDEQDWVEKLRWIGQIFIAITFGAIFSGVYSASLTALVERIYFLSEVVPTLFRLY